MNCVFVKRKIVWKKKFSMVIFVHYECVCVRVSREEIECIKRFWCLGCSHLRRFIRKNWFRNNWVLCVCARARASSLTLVHVIDNYRQIKHIIN